MTVARAVSHHKPTLPGILHHLLKLCNFTLTTLQLSFLGNNNGEDMQLTQRTGSQQTATLQHTKHTAPPHPTPPLPSPYQ